MCTDVDPENRRYLTVELDDGTVIYDSPAEVPCDMVKWVKRTGNSANAGVTQSLWNMGNPNWVRMSFITDAGDRVAAGCVQRFLHPRHRNVDGRKNELLPACRRQGRGGHRPPLFANPTWPKRGPTAANNSRTPGYASPRSAVVGLYAPAIAHPVSGRR